MSHSWSHLPLRRSTPRLSGCGLGTAWRTEAIHPVSLLLAKGTAVESFLSRFNILQVPSRQPQADAQEALVSRPPLLHDQTNRRYDVPIEQLTTQVQRRSRLLRHVALVLHLHAALLGRREESRQQVTAPRGGTAVLDESKVIAQDQIAAWLEDVNGRFEEPIERYVLG